MKKTDTTEELVVEDYTTTAELLNEFNKTWRPKGFFFLTSMNPRSDGEGVIGRCEVFFNMENPTLVATGHAEQLRSASTFNSLHYFATCETFAVGKALRLLGVIKTSHIASVDEIEASGGKIKEKPKRKEATYQEALESVKRLKLGYKEEDTGIFLLSKSIGQKKLDILSRHGFVKDENEYMHFKKGDTDAQD